MEYTTLGSSDIRVSRLCLGTWAIGGWMWGGSDENAAVRTIHAALDKGINFIDTAPVYGFGRAEEIVGKAIKAHDRDNIVLATKVGLEWDARQKVKRNATAARIRDEIDASLKRLQTSHIDLYQVHWPDPCVPWEETAEAMLALQRQGKIRAVGVSNYNPKQMDAFRAHAPLHSVQPPYNLFERGSEADILPYAHTHGLAVLSYGAICRGLLSGKHRADAVFTGDDLRRHDPKFKAPRYEMYLRAVDQLHTLARERFAKSVMALALRWVIDRGTIALWGARQPEQLDAVSDVLGWQVDARTMTDIDTILKNTITDPVGPEFMAPPTRQPLRASVANSATGAG